MTEGEDISDECPKCGNIKHKEIIHVDLENKKSRVWRCKACGHTEYDFSEYENGKDKEAVERMGDAFRDFLSEKNK
jgi:uncharacterized Zn finger protein